ncbi:MAG: hypothetical protein MZV70_06995 [Desulfobacterales bacterium]|nr:hypothetical protein [Desulfobacterales bacterium]
MLCSAAELHSRHATPTASCSWTEARPVGDAAEPRARACRTRSWKST